MILFLFFSLAHAQVWKPAWNAPLPGDGRAAYFFAQQNKILVSVQFPEKSELLQLDFDGKNPLVLTTVAEGGAGAIRSYEGTIFWVVGKSVFSVTEGKASAKIQSEKKIADISVSQKGELLLAKGEGIFFLWPDLFRLEEGILFQKDKKLPLKCSGCWGLEKIPGGAWFSSRGTEVVELGKNKPKAVLSLEREIGRIGYIYARDSKDDILLVPVGNSLRAFGKK